MSTFNKGEIDQGLAFLEAHEKTLLEIETDLRNIGHGVTSQKPRVLEKPFGERAVEAYVKKALTTVGSLLGAMTATSRQLRAEREGAETGLFDGEVRPADELEMTGLPIEVIEAAQAFVDDVRKEMGDDDSVTITAAGKRIIITASGIETIEKSIEGVTTFVGEVTEILGEGAVVVEGSSVTIKNLDPTVEENPPE